MKKRTGLKILGCIVIVFICSLIFINVRQYLKANEALKYFEEFYTAEELELLKENIEPEQCRMDSENYKIILKGMWAQGNCASYIFEIQGKKSGIEITQEDIKSVIWNKNFEDNTEGNLILRRVKYKEKGNRNYILEVGILSEDTIGQLDIKIRIKEEQFLFTLPTFFNKKAKQAISASDDVVESVYVSSMSLCIVLPADGEISDSEICLNFSDGRKQEIRFDDGYVSGKKENANIYMLFLESVCDVEQLESITVGEVTYEFIKTDRRN